MRLPSGYEVYSFKPGPDRSCRFNVELCRNMGTCVRLNAHGLVGPQRINESNLMANDAKQIQSVSYISDNAK